ncbi:CLUMA_CG015703, isoform A [Clunio marinus]|uniref:CLUMA_CG015703, isoform A n=1 Tax=Clunio marinus TaxID=568069 RepID=A0A1J1IRF0_9DIPT|nr:CLUMA_CG015703, isoform A [Clunio marinus]
MKRINKSKSSKYYFSIETDVADDMKWKMCSYYFSVSLYAIASLQLKKKRKNSKMTHRKEEE